MNFTYRNTSGFTLLELLLVVSIAVIILGMAFVGFQDYARFQQYNQAVSDVEFTLQQARDNARMAVDDSAHGVKILNDRVIYFIGDTYTPGFATNQVTQYTLATFSPSFTGGVDEIIFAKLTGLPSATGTIQIYGTTYAATTTLSLSNTGVIQ